MAAEGDRELEDMQPLLDIERSEPAAAAPTKPDPRLLRNQQLLSRAVTGCYAVIGALFITVALLLLLASPWSMVVVGGHWVVDDMLEQTISIEPSAWRHEIPNVRVFLVHSSQTSGSTWLVTHLGLHPDVYTPTATEQFRDYDQINDVLARLLRQPTAVTWEHWRQYLDHQMTELIEKMRQARPNAQALGCKMMNTQVPVHLRLHYAAWLRANEMSVVHLVREGTIEAFVSQFFMKALDRQVIHNSRAHSENEAQQLQTNEQRFLVPPSYAKLYLDSEARDALFFRRLLGLGAVPLPYFEVRYEQFTSPNRDLYMESLFAFLRVPPTPLLADASRTLVKLHKGSCDSKIRNWNIIRELLGDSDPQLVCMREW
eukprot:TRINITY_DN5071_c0_g1_i1.p2 TRINITY_DN5071_c0_g1~~TRINITY_DN5071_c0_g1_i1.p2  ORF type:complete len:372 (-),score=67.65 TRINITY_DN5071_c0_g1_i1:15-1130(-)